MRRATLLFRQIIADRIGRLAGELWGSTTSRIGADDRFTGETEETGGNARKAHLAGSFVSRSDWRDLAWTGVRRVEVRS